MIPTRSTVLYVIDEAGVLIDDIRVRELLLVPVTRRVADVMNRRVTALRAGDEQRLAIETFRREGRTALPVVDEQGVLIGIVTVDDVLNAAQDMATRDLQQFGGSEVLGEPYLAMSVSRMIRKRAGWLAVLFVGEMLTATAMGFFELWGALIGSMLPFVLRRLGFDPATSSAPFVATLVDVTGLIIYFQYCSGDPARFAAVIAHRRRYFHA